MKEYPNHSNGLLDPPKVLADVVESLLGAIFMDSNKSLEIVWKVRLVFLSHTNIYSNAGWKKKAKMKNKYN